MNRIEDEDENEDEDDSKSVSAISKRREKVEVREFLRKIIGQKAYPQLR